MYEDIQNVGEMSASGDDHVCGVNPTVIVC